MNVSEITPTVDTAPAATGPNKSPGKDEFLRLFVTKLKYQDPLSPMEDQAFVAQLAQFSSLEQLQNMGANQASSLQELQNLNDNLASSINWDVLNNQTINNSVAAEIIGKEVIANLSELTLDKENEPTMSYQLDEFASVVNISIVDANGALVRSIRFEDVTGGRNDFEWDGKNDAGDRLEPGSYAIEVVATDANGTTMNPDLSIVGVVKGVVYRGGNAFLKIDGAEVALGDVREINVDDGGN